MNDDQIIDPIDAIKQDMVRHGWTYLDIVRLTGHHHTSVNEYLNRKRKIPMSFIRAYHEIPETTPLEILIQDYQLNEPEAAS